jgi:hypothetical protein
MSSIDASSELFYARATETKSHERNGYFYRYIHKHELTQLIKGGELAFDGRQAFDRIVNGKKENPVHLPAEQIVSYFFLSHASHVIGVKLDNKNALVQDGADWQGLIQRAQDQLSSVDSRYTYLDQVMYEAFHKKDTQPMVDFLRGVGGEGYMIFLRRADWASNMASAFSDVIALSAGAPLFEPKSDNAVVEFSLDSVIVPDNDMLHEHDVFVHALKKSDVTEVYTQKNWHTLAKLLHKRYPDQFYSANAQELMNFARAVPVETLLTKI